MILYELLETINDNCIVEIYRADTAELVGIYDGKENIPEWFNDDEVTDIFANFDTYKQAPTLCIEIDTEPDPDYELDYDEALRTPCDYPDTDIITESDKIMAKSPYHINPLDDELEGDIDDYTFDIDPSELKI